MKVCLLGGFSPYPSLRLHWDQAGRPTGQCPGASLRPGLHRSAHRARARGPGGGARSTAALPPAVPTPVAPLPLPIFRAHALQGAERTGQARTCPRAGPRVPDRDRHLGAEKGGGRAAEGTDQCPSPAAGPGAETPGLYWLPAPRAPPSRGSYLLLIRQLLLQIRHFPSGDKPRR